MRLTPKKVIVLFVYLLLYAPLVLAQTPSKIKAVRDKMWGLEDTDFKASLVPDKWKKESAVVLCRSFEYQVKKQAMTNYVDENLYTRNRIKLQDQSAVNRYSEMSFQSSKFIQMSVFGAGDSKDVFMGIKVIKPNGKEKEIPISEAVTMEMKSGAQKEKYQKIAVPDLEPGDIIDYYYCIEKSTMNGQFDRILFALASTHPIVKQKMEIRIMRKCHVNAKYLNGAPQLKLKPNQDDDVYSLVDQDREKVDEDQPWLYENRSVPTINFRAYYMKYTFGGAEHWLGKQGELNTVVSEKNLLDYMNFLLTYVASADQLYPVSRELNSFMKKRYRSENNPEVIASEAYHYLRQKAFASPFEKDILYGKGPNGGYGLGNFEYIASLISLLSKREIDHDIVIAVPRTLSDIKDLILPQDISYLIRVNSPKPFFVGYPARFDNYFEVGQALEGTNAYAVNMTQRVRDRTLQKLIIPVSHYETNGSSTKMIIRLDAENLHVQRTVMAKGYPRFSHAHTINSYDYLYDSRSENYDFTLMEKKSLSRKEKEELDRKISLYKQQEEKDRLEKMKTELEKDFDAKVTTYDQFKLKQVGMWKDNPDLVYEDKFQVEGLLTPVKAGYLLDAGKLIGKQMELTKDQLTRQNDIYMPCARSYANSFEIAIPDGYEAKGLEKLNYNETNPTGGFVSQAKMEGNVLKISTRKYYTHNFEKAQDWSQLTVFMETAYAFTQQKILLQKVAATAQK
jgi:hypothetical protein